MQVTYTCLPLSSHKATDCSLYLETGLGGRSAQIQSLEHLDVVYKTARLFAQRLAMKSTNTDTLCSVQHIQIFLHCYWLYSESSVRNNEIKWYHHGSKFNCLTHAAQVIGLSPEKCWISRLWSFVEIVHFDVCYSTATAQYAVYKQVHHERLPFEMWMGHDLNPL
jgi:hypothetical protein